MNRCVFRTKTHRFTSAICGTDLRTSHDTRAAFERRWMQVAEEERILPIAMYVNRRPLYFAQETSPLSLSLFLSLSLDLSLALSLSRSLSLALACALSLALSLYRARALSLYLSLSLSSRQAPLHTVDFQQKAMWSRSEGGWSRRPTRVHPGKHNKTLSWSTRPHCRTNSFKRV